jgi:hypothetical protein
MRRAQLSVPARPQLATRREPRATASVDNKRNIHQTQTLRPICQASRWTRVLAYGINWPPLTSII